MSSLIQTKPSLCAARWNYTCAKWVQFASHSTVVSFGSFKKMYDDHPIALNNELAQRTTQQNWMSSIWYTVPILDWFNKPFSGTKSQSFGNFPWPPIPAGMARLAMMKTGPATASKWTKATMATHWRRDRTVFWMLETWKCWRFRDVMLVDASCCFTNHMHFRAT